MVRNASQPEPIEASSVRSAVIVDGNFLVSGNGLYAVKLYQAFIVVHYITSMALVAQKKITSPILPILKGRQNNAIAEKDPFFL